MSYTYSTIFTTIFASFWVMFITFIVILYLYFRYAFKYYEKLGVETVGKPVFPVGNLGGVLLGKGTPSQIFSMFYAKIKGPCAGLYFLHKPALIIKDLDYIKYILVKDFNYFVDRGVQTDEQREPLMNHLFMLKGQKWRDMRNKLSSTFTSGKLKTMLPTLIDCGHELKNALLIAVETNEDIEIKEFVARFTTDIISSIGFGIKTNSVNNPKSEFRQYGKQIFKANFYKSIIDAMIFCAPELVRLFRLKFVNKEVTQFFTKVLTETIQYREKNNIFRNDYLQLLIQLKKKTFVSVNDSNSENKVKSEDGLSLEQTISQAFVFFIAGFETSSSTMTFCLYEMALNPDIQAKLQEEIDTVLAKYGGELTYDSISDMNYLDNVFSETVRKYPVLPLLNRQAVKDYKMPNSDLVIKKGTYIIIPISGLQRDPNYFHDPNKFDPDRFLPENKTWNPYCYLPFGEGPRNCIGARMGKIQTKIGLIIILSNFNVDVCSRTPIPMTFSKTEFVLTSEYEVVLKITPRNKNASE